MSSAASTDPTRWLAFLSEASKLLSASLDERETLDALAKLAVPTLADWCGIRMADDHDWRQASVLAHTAPEKMAALLDYQQRYPVKRSSHPAVPKPSTEGRPYLITDGVDEVFQGYARDAEELRFLRSLGVRSLLVVPLVARREAIGSLSLATAESGRVFTHDDVPLAEELAARAAMALDNARLFAAERRARADAEQALAAHEEQRRWLSAILEHSSAVIYGGGTDFRYRLANRAFARLAGRSPDAMVGAAVGDVLSPEETERALKLAAEMFAQKKPIQYEFETGFAGDARVYITDLFPIFDEAGAAVGWGGISHDITDRKRAEARARQSQERFQKIFRAATLSISVTRLSDGRFVDANAACEKLCGYTRDELLGKTGTDLGMWARAEDRARALATLAEQGYVRGFETQLRDRAGGLHDVLMSLDRIELDGEPCILAMAHDTTELKRLQSRLQHAHKMEALGRLAGGVAHDFNNLLTAVSGYAELAADALPPGAARQAVEHVRRAAGRAASLTQQLLLFGRLRPRSVTVLDLNATVTGLYAMLRRLIGEDIRLETALSPGRAPVEADPAQLEQVLLNLALNARDAMPSGGRLRIETAEVTVDGAPFVCLAVEDDGLGMDAATRARIFEPFFTTKEVGKGTGLGLATVYGVVEQADGRISVDSAPGRGTRFEILLPRSDGELKRSSSDDLPAVRAMKEATILVVEDDESVCAFVSLILASRSYRVLSAPDGEAALEVAARHDGTIDLLLTDLVMPRLNGRALALELRALLPRLRVMYMSGYPGDTIERYGDIPSGDLFLQKPFSKDQLLTGVAELLARSEP